MAKLRAARSYVHPQKIFSINAKHGGGKGLCPELRPSEHNSTILLSAMQQSTKKYFWGWIPEPRPGEQCNNRPGNYFGGSHTQREQRAGSEAPGQAQSCPQWHNNIYKKFGTQLSTKKYFWGCRAPIAQSAEPGAPGQMLRLEPSLSPALWGVKRNATIHQ